MSAPVQPGETPGLQREDASALLLTLRTIVTAATRDDHSLDRSLANQAWFALTAVNPVLQLEESLFTIRVDIVGNGRPTQSNGLAQHALNSWVEPS